jgi:hypothetical protein
MTNEELDEARAKEAWRKCDALGFGKDYESPTIIAARLAREGWMPPPPVDPDVLAVRRVLASLSNLKKDHDWYRDGTFDGQRSFQMALAAYKAGRAAR